MGVEYGKKENRSEPGFTLTMAEFLSVSVQLHDNVYLRLCFSGSLICFVFLGPHTKTHNHVDVVHVYLHVQCVFYELSHCHIFPFTVR